MDLVFTECTGLDSRWEHLTTETTFPIQRGGTITVTCSALYFNQGSDMITCNEMASYSYQTEPLCELVKGKLLCGKRSFIDRFGRYNFHYLRVFHN